MSEQTLNFEMPEDLEPMYSNASLISHNEAEFVFDFALMVPGQAGGKIGARVLMSPRQVKIYRDAITAHIKTYEDQFGPIPVTSDLAEQWIVGGQDDEGDHEEIT
jgi:hypothetical protein